MLKSLPQSNTMNGTCIGCCGPIELDGRLFAMEHIVPGDPPQRMTVVICPSCFNYALNASNKPVLESIINANITRDRYPDRKFSPK